MCAKTLHTTPARYFGCSAEVLFSCLIVRKIPLSSSHWFSHATQGAPGVSHKKKVPILPGHGLQGCVAQIHDRMSRAVFDTSPYTQMVLFWRNARAVGEDGWIRLSLRRLFLEIRPSSTSTACAFSLTLCSKLTHLVFS